MQKYFKYLYFKYSPTLPGTRRVRAARGLNKHPLYNVYIQIYFQAGKWTNEIGKPQVSINSDNSSIYYRNCNHRKWIFGTGNRK